MEFQQKGQQITLSQGVIFMKTDGEELQWEKKYCELTFMVKAFTQNGGSYCAYELALQKKMLFHFLIRTTTKTPFMVICHTAKHALATNLG
jgi:hypothetical protein